MQHLFEHTCGAILRVFFPRLMDLIKKDHIFSSAISIPSMFLVFDLVYTLF